jgi:hypothetical protein
MPTKNEIKEAVSESLLEALQVAEDRQRKDSTSIKSIVATILSILQVFLVPVLAYLLLQSVQIQKEIVDIKAKMISIDDHVTDHITLSDIKSKETAAWHHTKNILACDDCHGSNKILKKAK